MKTPAAELIRYGGVTIRLYDRANGQVSLSWSEGGKARRTTRADKTKAREWAARKARELDAATGARWVTPASADRLAWLEEIAGGPEQAGRVLTALGEAKEHLHGDLSQLGKAVAWYVKHGPPAVERQTVQDAVEAFLAEYKAHHPSATVRPVRSELRSFAAAHGTGEMIQIGHAEISAHVYRAVDGRPPAKRTIRNRVSAWTTFFHRCEALGWWPEGKRHPSSKVKRPRLDDKAPAIFTPETAAALVAMVAAEARQHLPFLLIAGWLGCRPSECQRLRKADFDFSQRLLHVRHDVARKTARERWVPLSPALSTCLQALFRDDAEGKLGMDARGGKPGNRDKACRHHSQEAISALARARGVIPEWPADVLRHSFITYRLQELGSIDRTAEEAGNSPAEIRASYKRPIPPGTWRRWQAALAPAEAASRT